MVETASDDSRGGRVLTGTVNAIAQHAGYAFAIRIARGDINIKVDAPTPAGVAGPHRQGAAYVMAARAGGANGGTTQVKTDLDIQDFYHRSVVRDACRDAKEVSAQGDQPPVRDGRHDPGCDRRVGR